MNVALVAPTAIPIPLGDRYGGIEREVEWLAEALVQLGHDVTVFGNMHRKQLDGVEWKGVPIASEDAIIRHLPDLMAFDVVHDWSHLKPLRAVRIRRYVSTTMYSDQVSGRDVFPSRAVAESFGQPKARVIYLGLPTSSLPEPAMLDDAAPYVSFGRIAPYKGQDLAIEVARAAHVPLVIAGHTGAFADAYYALMIEKKARDAGFKFLGDLKADEIDRFLEFARGLLHLHRWLESFSLVIAHALCLGVPVLTTEVGGPKELLADTGGGTVVGVPEDAAKWPRTPPDVAAYFSTTWDRRAIATRARERFDIGRIAKEYTKLYEGLS